MYKVVMWVSDRLRSQLPTTVLWRGDVERVFVDDAEAAWMMAREEIGPRLVLLEANDSGTTDLLRRFRSDSATRHLSVAVLDPTVDGVKREELLKAGANVVLSQEQGPALWDDAFERLMNVPRRREVRTPVGLKVGARPTSGVAPELEATALNISVHGLMIQTTAALPVETLLNLSFRLPGNPDELALVGKVVWTRRDGGTSQSGVKFLGFRADSLERIRAFVDSRGGLPAT